MTDENQGGAIAKELERLAVCEGGVRGGSERAAETMRQAAKLIRSLSALASEQPEPVAWLVSDSKGKPCRAVLDGVYAARLRDEHNFDVQALGFLSITPALGYDQ